MPTSLRRQLLVYLTAVFALFLAGLIYERSGTEEQVHAAASTRASDLARGYARQYEALLRERLTVLETLFRLPGSQLDDPARCEGLLRHVVVTDGSLVNLVLLDERDEVHCQAREGAIASAAADAVASARASRGPIFGASGTEGQVRAWVVLARPFFDGRTEYRGAIVAFIDRDWLNSRFADAVTGGVALRILDGKGVFVVRQPDPDCCVGTSGLHLAGIADAIAGGTKPVQASRWQDGVDRIQADLPLAPPFGGVVSVGIPEQLIRAEAARAAPHVGWLAAALCAVLYALSWLFSERAILKPLRALSDGTRRLRGGDLSFRIAETPVPSEFERLRQDFNDMAGRLENSHDNIEADLRMLTASEAALRESESRFRRLYEHAPLPHHTVDADGRIIDVNEAWCALFGRRREEVVGTWIGRYVSESSRTLLGERFTQVSTEGRADGNLYEVVRADGTTRLVEFNSRAVRTPAGAVLQVHSILTDVTERRETELRLKLAASVFEQANEAFTITDADGNIVAVSPRFSAITGYEADEVVGRNPRLLRSGRHDADFYRSMWRSLADRGHWNGEIWNRRKDGTVYPEWLSISAVRDQAGKTTHYVAVFSDLTVRKAAERAVRQSAALMRLILDSALDAVVCIGRDGRVLEWNAQAERMFGYPRAAAIGAVLAELVIPPRLRDAHAAGLEGYLARGGDAAAPSRRVEVSAMRADRSEFPAELTIAAVQGEAGLVFSAFIRDISESRARQDALRTSEQRLATLIGTIPDAIFFKDGEGRWLVINDAARDLFELRSIAWHGRTDLELATLNPSRAAEHRACWESDEAAWEARGPIGTTEVIRAAGSGERTIDVTKVPLFDGNGARQALVIVGRDVTEREVAAEASRKLNEVLEQRVQERTEDLQTANRELESFAYSVSHDLRAPLRAINGFAKLLEEESGGSLDAKARGYLDRVCRASATMGELIDDLLTLARVARHEMTFAPTDLSRIAREIAAELRAAEPRRDVDWVIAENIVVECDPGLLRSVLGNLLGNAWKYTSKRPSARIEFGVRRENGETAYCVTDNGAGFDMAFADKLFGTFQRLHSPTEFPGTGIGLATVARIVRRHGGRVGAEGRVGHGATFWFTLGSQGRPNSAPG